MRRTRCEYRGRKIGRVATSVCFSFRREQDLTTVDGGLLLMKHRDATAIGVAGCCDGTASTENHRTDFRCEDDPNGDTGSK
jgi:dTDP-4-amino-4,6-dideoxygalactose transaminase